MEKRVRAGARGQDERIALEQVRRAHRTEVRLEVVRERIVVELLEDRGVQLDAPRRSVEADFSVAAQLAGLVFAIGHGVLDVDFLGDLAEIVLVA